MSLYTINLNLISKSFVKNLTNNIRIHSYNSYKQRLYNIRIYNSFSSLNKTTSKETKDKVSEIKKKSLLAIKKETKSGKINISPNNTSNEEFTKIYKLLSKLQSTQELKSYFIKTESIEEIKNPSYINEASSELPGNITLTKKNNDKSSISSNNRLNAIFSENISKLNGDFLRILEKNVNTNMCNIKSKLFKGKFIHSSKGIQSLLSELIHDQYKKFYKEKREKENNKEDSDDPENSLIIEDEIDDDITDFIKKIEHENEVKKIIKSDEHKKSIDSFANPRVKAEKIKKQTETSDLYNITSSLSIFEEIKKVDFCNSIINEKIIRREEGKIKDFKEDDDDVKDNKKKNKVKDNILYMFPSNKYKINYFSSSLLKISDVNEDEKELSLFDINTEILPNVLKQSNNYYTTYELFKCNLQIILNHSIKVYTANNIKNSLIQLKQIPKSQFLDFPICNVIRVMVDGGCRGYDKSGYIGVTIYINDTNILQITANIGESCTNNIAEYYSMITGLILIDFIPFSDFINKEKFLIYFFADSELVIKQINKEYKVKNNGISILKSTCDGLIDILKQKNMPIVFQHVRRELNKEADYLSNLADKIDKHNEFTIIL